MEFNDGAETARSDIENRYLWARLDHEHAAAIRSVTVASIVDAQRRKNQLSPDNNEDSAGFLDYERDAQRFALQTDWSVELDATLIEFGAAIEYARATYDALGLIDRGDTGVLLGRPAVEALDIHSTIDGPLLGLYAAMDLAIGPSVSIQPGIRFDAQSYDPDGATHHVSPRFGLEWLASETTTVRLSAGRFYQPEAFHELQVTDGVSRFFAPQRADHFIAAVDWKATPRLSLRAEGYYKDYGNPKTRFETYSTLS
ncbi:MAG: TonB-dependent receptor [Gammaproteobacteria bacterium]|nr:TonB-dependent receptor [Gammaproteobacteria bacterium]